MNTSTCPLHVAVRSSYLSVGIVQPVVSRKYVTAKSLLHLPTKRAYVDRRLNQTVSRQCQDNGRELLARFASPWLDVGDLIFVFL